MIEPEFHYDRGIATCRWKEPHVSMTFDWLRVERRTGEVRAELVVNNGKPKPLYRSPLILTGPNAKRDAARDLGELMRLTGGNWREMLETACWATIDAHRTGRPAVNLWDSPDPPDSGLLLPPLLVKDDAVCIFGDGGWGKSYTGLALALSLQTGHPLVGYFRPLTRLRVAYLDWEWRSQPHKKRMRALLGDEPDANARALKYIPCMAEGPLSHQIDRLRRIFHEFQIEYAVLDSVALACDGPPEDSMVALAFFQALARLEVGACLLAHTNRVGDPMKPFGSVFWNNSARLTWNVQLASEADDRLNIVLHNRKVNDGHREKPIGLEYQFGERTIINCVEIAEKSADQKADRSATSTRTRLLRLLEVGDGATYEDAALQLDSTPDYVRKLVREDMGRTIRKWDDPDDHRVTRLGLVKVNDGAPQ